MVRNDPLRKGIIQELVFPFLQLFFPNEEFDINRQPGFPDKETEEICDLLDLPEKYILSGRKEILGLTH